ncbi:MAG: PDZ domain-containing protein [Clostridia bacterium]|nr:PDZ domain-containing protein [Clostridia bacterium]
MNRKFSLRSIILIGLAGLLAGVVLAGVVTYALMGDMAKTFIKLSEIDFFVDRYFYGEVDSEKLEKAICEGYVEALDDKYAKYLAAEDAAVNFDHLEGNRSGIGVTVVKHPDNDCIYVVDVSENGPAHKVGIRAGDVISKVGDVAVTEETYIKCVDMLIGEIGDTISVTRLSDGKKLDIIVDKFEVQSVFYRMIGDYAYIRISAFSDNSVEQFKNALNKAQDSNAKGLIFDVTGNGGGTVDSVAEILDMLLPEGEIMSVKYANGASEVLHRSDKEEVDLPMVVLTDKFTASAAELFSISIRDYDKGVLIGQPTYGKGVMQTTYRLDDGSSIKFTVAQFFSKSKTDFRKDGIIPDEEFSLSEYEQKYFYLLGDDENPYIQRAIKYLNEQ